MISGVVTNDAEATVRLRIRAANGREHECRALIDTGFNGYLALPTSLVTDWGLSLTGSARAVLGDGSDAVLSLSEAAVRWDGRRRVVDVLAVADGTLVGMSMLKGYRLNVDVHPGGVVLIERLVH